MKPFRLLTLFALIGCSGMLMRAADAPKDTVVLSEHFESVSTDTEMTTNFWGNVDVTGNNIHITCDRIVIVSQRLGDKTEVVTQQNQFKSLIATGKVKVVQGDREANCGRAVVLPAQDKVTLTEKPVVIDHGSGVTWIGENLVLFRGERRVLGENVKVILPEMKDLGFDKNKSLDLPATVNKPDASK